MVFVEIWQSFRRLPLWVQIWVALILIPVNLIPLVLFLQGAPGWVLIALLSVGGMALNLPIMLMERGFSRTMALPHVVLWTPLVLLLIGRLEEGDALVVLILLVDVVSLAFDYVDAVKWWRGDRAVA
ncbi:MAG: hypothetical protein MRY77_16390 [Rhodobacteraceae bacterium]|nr:hypothetical protein [Paracoccaceae bacterium]